MREPVCHFDTEAEYFHRRDAELIDEMRKRAALDEQRRRMAEACQTENPRILDALEKLGYDSTTIPLLYLVPLVHVAWIDGSVNQAERSRIMVMAALQGLRENVSADQQLTLWLDQRPSEEFFRGTLQVIRAILESLPENTRKTRKEFLIRRCREVAFASCSRFGWKSRVCFSKRFLIRQIGRLLEPAEQTTAAAAGV